MALERRLPNRDWQVSAANLEDSGEDSEKPSDKLQNIATTYLTVLRCVMMQWASRWGRDVAE